MLRRQKGQKRRAVAAQQQQQVVVAARQLLLLMMKMRLRTRAQSAWTTRMMRLWMGMMLECVLRAGSLTVVRATQLIMLEDYLVVQPASTNIGLG